MLSFDLNISHLTAQKLGLVEQPQQLLNEDDWQKLKIKSSERDDFKNPCVICKEELGMQQQVLLSCSHVFHRVGESFKILRLGFYVFHVLYILYI